MSDYSKYLAIDYGEVRIGIAICDELKILARPFDVLKNDKLFKSKIEKIILENNISKIIIGLPLNMKGEKSAKTIETEKFKVDVLDKLNVEIIFLDERLTSKQAAYYNSEINTKKKSRENKGNIDKYAATIILQSYLDTVKR